ncbi:MAG: EAL domain-containing protein [Dolichospermum sp.]
MPKILVIEDEESVRKNLLDLLEAENFETVVADNGKIGINMAMSENPDLILCDMTILDLDDYGVLTALSQDPLTSTIPFIFLTAKLANSDFRQGINMRTENYLTQPFTKAELLTAVVNKLQMYSNLEKQFSSTDHQLSPRMQIVLKSLQQVIKEKKFQEFEVYYQPITDLNTGRITSAESLLRWQSPELGTLSPQEFIPLAESYGLIVDIGKWVLNTVCQQLSSWQDVGIDDITVAVNISAVEFNQSDLVLEITDLISSYNIQSNCLEIELTERRIIEDIKLAADAMNNLRSLGVKIAIDDFGVSNNSLIYLKELPIDTLKIDRYFIQNIDEDFRKAAITKSLIQLGHDLELKIVAEGVETEAELAFLRENNCDAIQGFIYSPALPMGEFKKLLLSNKS